MDNLERQKISELVSELYKWAVSVGVHVGDRDDLAQSCHDKTREVAGLLKEHGIHVDCWLLDSDDVNAPPPPRLNSLMEFQNDE